MIYICWNETEQVFKGWNYTGGGEVDPIMESVQVKRSALYARENNKENRDKAKRWIETDRPSAWIEIRKE